MNIASRALQIATSIVLLIPICGFKPNAAQNSRVAFGADFIVTAAPVYDLLAELRGQERFPSGAQLLLVHEGKSELLVKGFAATADKEKRPGKTGGDYREKLNVAHDRLRDAQQELAQLPGKVSEKEQRRDGDLLIIRESKREMSKTRHGKPVVGVPTRFRRRSAGSVLISPKVSTESATNIADLEKQAKAADDEIAFLKKRQKDLQKQTSRHCKQRS